MFSECREINARSILPCMDTPAVKQTYSANVDKVFARKLHSFVGVGTGRSQSTHECSDADGTGCQR